VIKANRCVFFFLVALCLSREWLGPATARTSRALSLGCELHGLPNFFSISSMVRLLGRSRGNPRALDQMPCARTPRARLTCAHAFCECA
jgi:hypothetical protein